MKLKRKVRETYSPMQIWNLLQFIQGFLQSNLPLKGFIEARLNPNYLPQTLPKKPSQKKNETALKKTKERIHRAKICAGTAMPRHTAVCQVHGWSCVQAQPGHDRASLPAACVWLLPRVHGCAALLHGRVICCFSLLCFC